MTPAELEAMMLFLAHHKPMFDAFCRDMGVEPGRIAKAIAKEHATRINDSLQIELDEAREALKWALDMTPSPCRCMTFSTPPHVCKGHRALAGLRAETPASDGV